MWYFPSSFFFTVDLVYSSEVNYDDPKIPLDSYEIYQKLPEKGVTTTQCNKNQTTSFFFIDYI